VSSGLWLGDGRLASQAIRLDGVQVTEGAFQVTAVDDQRSNPYPGSC
jgi:hypothetical protein